MQTHDPGMSSRCMTLNPCTMYHVHPMSTFYPEVARLLTCPLLVLAPPGWVLLFIQWAWLLNAQCTLPWDTSLYVHPLRTLDDVFHLSTPVNVLTTSGSGNWTFLVAQTTSYLLLNIAGTLVVLFPDVCYLLHNNNNNHHHPTFVVLCLIRVIFSPLCVVYICGNIALLLYLYRKTLLTLPPASSESHFLQLKQIGQLSHTIVLTNVLLTCVSLNCFAVCVHFCTCHLLLFMLVWLCFPGPNMLFWLTTARFRGLAFHRWGVCRSWVSLVTTRS